MIDKIKKYIDRYLYNNKWVIYELNNLLFFCVGYNKNNFICKYELLSINKRNQVKKEKNINFKIVKDIINNKIKSLELTNSEYNINNSNLINKGIEYNPILEENEDDILNKLLEDE
jgi:hypothetical protein